MLRLRHFRERTERIERRQRASGQVKCSVLQRNLIAHTRQDLPLELFDHLL